MMLGVQGGHENRDKREKKEIKGKLWTYSPMAGNE